MSCTYEAIFARVSQAELRDALGTVAPKDSAFAFVAVGAFSGACRQSGRSEPFAVNEMNLLAAHVSVLFGKAVVAYYDDRVGLRRAIAFAGTEAAQTFGPSDELWSPLDKEGYADPTAAKTRREFDDEEIECVVTAISLALQTLGAAKVEAKALHQAVVAVA